MSYWQVYVKKCYVVILFCLFLAITTPTACVDDYNPLRPHPATQSGFGYCKTLKIVKTTNILRTTSVLWNRHVCRNINVSRVKNTKGRKQPSPRLSAFWHIYRHMPAFPLLEHYLKLLQCVINVGNDVTCFVSRIDDWFYLLFSPDAKIRYFLLVCEAVLCFVAR